MQALMTAGVIFCSTRMLFMLRDPKYFAVSSSQIGRVNSSLIFVALISTIPITLVSGYCYDLFGRKTLILFNSLMLCLLCYWMPYTAPNLQSLQIVYILIRAAMIFVSCNPLLVDYVDKGSLGKAAAMSNMGALVGDCFAMGFLITITSEMSHENAFYITAVLISSLVLPMFFIIDEPRITAVDLSKKDEDHLPEERTRASIGSEALVEKETVNYLTQIKQLSKTIWNCCTNDVRYIVAFMAVLVSRPVSMLFSVYCLMWIVSFVDSGEVASDLEAQRIFQKITLIAMLGTSVALPMLGHASDKLGAHLTVPLAFAMRAVVLTSFLFIRSPDTFAAYLLCSLTIITSAM